METKLSLCINISFSKVLKGWLLELVIIDLSGCKYTIHMSFSNEYLHKKMKDIGNRQLGDFYLTDTDDDSILRYLPTVDRLFFRSTHFINKYELSLSNGKQILEAIRLSHKKKEVITIVNSCNTVGYYFKLLPLDLFNILNYYISPNLDIYVNIPSIIYEIKLLKMRIINHGNYDIALDLTIGITDRDLVNLINETREYNFMTDEISPNIGYNKDRDKLTIGLHPLQIELTREATILFLSNLNKKRELYYISLSNRTSRYRIRY